MDERRVVVTGIGPVTPVGTGLEPFWSSLTAGRSGIDFIHVQHPDVHIVCAAVDRALNERGFIVPGLGDAGDRLYGTK